MCLVDAQLAGLGSHRPMQRETRFVWQEVHCYRRQYASTEFQVRDYFVINRPLQQSRRRTSVVVGARARAGAEIRLGASSQDACMPLKCKRATAKHVAGTDRRLFTSSAVEARCRYAKERARVSQYRDRFDILNSTPIEDNSIALRSRCAHASATTGRAKA